MFDRVLATVLFTDIVGSTEQAARVGDAAWQRAHSSGTTRSFARMLAVPGREIDTAGDGFFVTFDGPARAIRCAPCDHRGGADRSVSRSARASTRARSRSIDGKVGGIAVHIGARVAALAGPSEVLVSSTVKDLAAGSGLIFEDAGEHELRASPTAGTCTGGRLNGDPGHPLRDHPRRNLPGLPSRR